ncbi:MULTISPECIES: hypothetical protein [unclassified Microcoleus]|uniref:hypothetical protein n=1 Tax=unclassified Microcoleus TaxID=2642155 RepID=UPI002FD1A5DD
MSQPGLTAIECAPTQTKPARVKSFLSARRWTLFVSRRFLIKRYLKHPYRRHRSPRHDFRQRKLFRQQTLKKPQHG